MKVHELLLETDFNPYKNYNLSNPGTKNVPKVSTPEEIAEIISTHASDMLEAYKKAGSVLYRGMKTIDSIPDAKWDAVLPSFVITGIRPDRKPVEMHPERHEFLHDAFISLGLKATRKNSIFCTAIDLVASNWGEAHIVFVKNGWSATIFEKVKNDYAFYNLEDLDYDTPEDKQKSIEKIKRLKPRNIETPSDLAIAIKSKYHDVLISGDSFIALKLNSAETKKVLKILKVKAQ